MSPSPQMLAAALPSLMRASFQKRGLGEMAVVTHWPAIVGATLAGVSCPERLSPGRGATPGTLTVRVRPAFALEMQHLAPAVIERVNSFYGHAKVGRLKLVQGPVPERRGVRRRTFRALTPAEEAGLRALLAGPTEEPLKAALEALGRSLIAVRPGPPEGSGRPAEAPIGNS